jgi:heat shock protein HslJ
VGHYTARYQQDGGAITVRRNLVISRQVVAPDAYPDLEKLIYAALVDARATIVLTHLAQ